MTEQATEAPATIRTVRLSKWYGKVTALQEVSLHLDSGIWGLLGPNGSGKTTFLRLVAGQLPVAQAIQQFGERAVGRVAERFGRLDVLSLVHGVRSGGAGTPPPLRVCCTRGREGNEDQWESVWRASAIAWRTMSGK